MTYTRQDIDALIASRSRELTSRENQENHQDSAVFSTRPREVLKNKNIKKLNNVSRELREESDRTCPSDSLGERTSFPEVSPEGLEGQGQGVMSSAAAIISSRELSGILAQHSRTKNGIKVMLTLQKANEADSGAIIPLTAELKRSDRLRELKPYEGDSEDFAEFYHMVKKSIREEEDTQLKKSMCLGRIHERGKRALWQPNMLVVGFLGDNNILTSIKLYYDDEYVIPMDSHMSERQKEIFHCNGIYGNIQRIHRTPSLDSIPRRYF